MVKVRFAPSPTGKLHVGNIRIAMLNYLFTTTNQGKFVLRIDDTDQIRSTKESEELIINDLKWLGISWDEFYRQSERIALYDKTLEQLIQVGRVYKCFETKDELSLKRKIQISQGVPPVYDRAALKLSDAQIHEYESEGRQGYWRFKLNQDETVHWHDLVHGDISIPLNSISDPILVRPDGSYMYTFASVVDDSDIGITHIIRGDDHITNTAAQIDMFRALGCEPKFGHIPLMTSADGSDVSKRTASPLSIVNMRNAGVEPIAIWDILTTLGTANNPDHRDTLETLKQKFSLDNRSLSVVKFNLDEVYSFTKKIISEKSFGEVKDQLLGMSLSKATPEFWDTIKNNINKIGDAADWYKAIYEEIPVKKQDVSFVQMMLDNLSDNFGEWIKLLKEKSGRKGFELYHPIRLVLTGKDSGPELTKIFSLLGVEKIKSRIEANLKAQ